MKTSDELSCKRMCEVAHASCERMPVGDCTRDCEAGGPPEDRCRAPLSKLFECMRAHPTFECNDRGLPEPIECAGRVLALQDCHTSPPGWKRVVHPTTYFSVLMPGKLEPLKAGDGLGFAGVEDKISFTAIEIPIERAKAIADRSLYVASIAKTFAEKCAPGTRVAAGSPSEDGISTTFQTRCDDGSSATGYVVQSPEALTNDALLFHALIVRGEDIAQRAALFINSFRVHPPLSTATQDTASTAGAGGPSETARSR